ncbi:WD40 repeat-like protein [Rhizophagus irregularis]|uniref:WD40 repeat-like protein n=1 Tax=Rhizophagus irregularis TaxID=588596 RepID=A0A2I1G658_9GLOM|nr:WD40 repeat-like protein [Rhizophagus irregularis]
MDTQKFQKLFYAGPITSLCFHNDIILLSGQGPYLKVFYVPTGNLLYSHPIMEYWRIYRIVPVKFVKKEEITVEENKNNKTYYNSIIKEQRLLAIYGSKTIQIVNISIDYYKDKLELPRVSITLGSRLSPLRDWVHDVKWLYGYINNSTSTSTNSVDFVGSSITNPAELAIAFAHNFVEIYNIQNNTCVYSIQCEERCILYSARFFGDTLNELILASGTVFNQVHLWDVMKKNEFGDGVVFKKLIGHEGVIFGVNFSDDGKIISSVSDDRTIRVWKTDRNEKSNPLIFYGHMARVWDCQILDNYLVSISEDSTCRVWQNSIDLNVDDEASDVNCLACWEGHVGKSVWSLAIDPSRKIVATGGGDSEIRLWSLSSVTNNKIGMQFFFSEHSDKDLIKIELPPVDSYAHLETIEKNLHQYKVFELFLEETEDPNILYVVSHAVHNEIYLLKLDLNDSEPRFEILCKLSVPPRFQLMSLAFCPSYSLLICGSRESGLVIYNLNSPILSNTENSIKELSPIIYLKKTHGRQAVTSVAFRIDKLKSNEEEVLMIYTSGRDGGYIKYRLRGLSILNLKTNYSESTEKDPIIIEINKTKHCDDDLYEDTKDYNIDSDNSAKELQKKELVDGLILEQVYKVKITKGWLERVVFVEDELILLGFFRKRFFVYNEDKKYEMFSVACGGAHRMWHFKAKDKRMDKASFMFIRKENVYIYSRESSAINEGFNECNLQGNFHGRECRIVNYLSYPLDLDLDLGNNDQKPIIFATGAEDSILRLFQYFPDKQEKNLVSLCSIKKHTSVIKSVEWSYGTELLLFSSGANEELRCWKVEVSLACNQPEAGSSAYPSVGVNCLEWSLCPAVSEIPETRIMDTSVCLINSFKGLHFIAAVYSDSVLRVWLFDEKKRNFFLIGDAKFHTRCILQVRHLVISAGENSKDGIILFTSATDGSYLDLYDKSNEAINSLDLGEPVYYYQAHQSGINCLAIHPMSYYNSLYMIVAGGDDNAISIAYFEILWDTFRKEDDYNKIQLIIRPKYREIVKIEAAHGSSIQGINVLNDTKILSTALDQRLNLWEIDFYSRDKIDKIDEVKYFVDKCDEVKYSKDEFDKRNEVKYTKDELDKRNEEKYSKDEFDKRNEVKYSKDEIDKRNEEKYSKNEFDKRDEVKYSKDEFDKRNEVKNEIDKRNEFKLIKSEFVVVCDPSSMNTLSISDNIVYITIVGIGIEIFKYEYIQKYTKV